MRRGKGEHLGHTGHVPLRKADNEHEPLLYKNRKGWQGCADHSIDDAARRWMRVADIGAEVAHRGGGGAKEVKVLSTVGWR